MLVEQGHLIDLEMIPEVCVEYTLSLSLLRNSIVFLRY